MRRSTLGLQLLSALTLALPASALPAQEAQVATAADERWSREELDNLLAPIALYPDPILAQVLVAATYPDQVLAAQAHVRAFGSDNVDDMPWELSVKAVARYEPVLNLLAEGEDWMTALGQAYATQPVDVMNAVQRLRLMANAQGNLQTSAQQQVVVEREVIRIVPAEPQIIYVPTYDPAVIYHRPVYVSHAHPAYWNWGVGYPVGVWLTYDVDWWGHRVYHHGWHSQGPRWVVVARPWIVLDPWYLSPHHTVVVVNRGVVHRRWDTHRVRRYSTIHRNVGYDRHDRGYRRDGVRGYAVDRRNSGNRAVGGNTIARGAGSRVGDRVQPLAGAPTRGARAGTRETVARRDGERARPSNGTWNPRAPRAGAQPTRAPRAGAQPSRAPRVDTPAPRANRNTAPRVSSPRASGQPAPRVSAPRRGGTSEPRASAPRGRSVSPPRVDAPRRNQNSAPRASAPRSRESDAPRASSPRNGSSSAPRASSPRSSGGGSARGSGGNTARGSGRPRGN